MEEYQKETLQLKQDQCDLIESGIIRAASVLIEKEHAVIEDDEMTLSRVRLYVQKLDRLLFAFDQANKNLQDYQKYVADCELKVATTEVDKNA